MSIAIKLFFVGMITVFVVLTLVVLIGRVLINITNRFEAPAPIPVAVPVSNHVSNTIHDLVINEAIKKMSNNKMKVLNIVKK